MTHHRLVVRASSPISFSFSPHTTLITNEMSDTFPPQRTRRHPPPRTATKPHQFGPVPTRHAPPLRLAVDSARAARLARPHTPTTDGVHRRVLSRAQRARRDLGARLERQKSSRAPRDRDDGEQAALARGAYGIDATERERMDRRCDAWGKRNARARARGTTRTRERAWGTRARIILARDHRETARTRRRARGWMDARVWDRVGSRARYPRAIGTRDRGSRTRARGGGVGENASSHARGWPGRARRDGRGRGARGRRRRVKGRSVSRDA